MQDAAAATELSTALPRAASVVDEGTRDGRHVGAQVYVSLAGEVIADVATGIARPGVSLTRDSMLAWMSCTKIVTATALAMEWQRGHLELDAPVCTYVPEFAALAKDRVTVRHLLTHTAPLLRADLELLAVRYTNTFAENVALICAAAPDPGWVPGRRAAYQVTAPMLLVAEIVRRVDGRDYDRWVRDDIFGPLGMIDSWIGMPREVARAYGDRLGIMYDTTGPEPKAGAWAPDTPEMLANIIPGGNGRGPLHELARVLELLLGNGRREDVRLLSPQTVAAMTARHRTGLRDEMWDARLDWGLGLMLDSKHGTRVTHVNGYGRHASERAFGHAGYRSSVAFADPEYGLVVAVIFNGMCDDAAASDRQNALCTAVYEDLGLDG